jgi:hypothetical protein
VHSLVVLNILLDVFFHERILLMEILNPISVNIVFVVLLNNWLFRIVNA